MKLQEIIQLLMLLDGWNLRYKKIRRKNKSLLHKLSRLRILKKSHHQNYKKRRRLQFKGLVSEELVSRKKL